MKRHTLTLTFLLILAWLGICQCTKQSVYHSHLDQQRTGRNAGDIHEHGQPAHSNHLDGALPEDSARLHAGVGAIGEPLEGSAEVPRPNHK